MGTVTIGVSIAVPEPHGSRLQQLRAGFGDAAAHGIPTHVTLLPPTEVDAAIVPAVEAHLSEVAASGRPFPMRLSGTGTFRPLSPVVFVKVVEGAEACAWLQGRIRDASGPVARELQFPYHPHVTVAQDVDDAALDAAYNGLSGFVARFAVDAFVLFCREPDGRWVWRTEFPLGNDHVKTEVRHP